MKRGTKCAHCGAVWPCHPERERCWRCWLPANVGETDTVACKHCGSRWSKSAPHRSCWNCHTPIAFITSAPTPLVNTHTPLPPKNRDSHPVTYNASNTVHNSATSSAPAQRAPLSVVICCECSTPFFDGPTAACPHCGTRARDNIEYKIFEFDWQSGVYFTEENSSNWTELRSLIEKRINEQVESLLASGWEYAISRTGKNVVQKIVSSGPSNQPWTSADTFGVKGFSVRMKRKR